MGLKRVTKKFLKYLIPTILVLLIIPLAETDRSRRDTDDIFRNGKIRCAIDLGDFDKMSKGFLTGYCYEMMSRFAEHLRDSVEIYLAEEGASCLDSLLLDSLDILALPSCGAPGGEGLSVLPLGDTSVVWVVKSGRKSQKEIIRWLNNFKATDEYASVHSRFFCGYNPFRKGIRKVPGIISPYDDLIRKNAVKMGWDWRLFAALIWSESRFRIQAHSSRGACGLMQMMPRTANRYEIEDLLNPAENIEAGAEYLARLQSKFRDTAADADELVKFTLGAYNAGEGRIYDCIRLALSQGIDASHWESLCTVLPQMNQDMLVVQTVSGAESAQPVPDTSALLPAAADTLQAPADSLLSAGNDPRHHGKFSGKETVGFVKAVLGQYEIFKGISGGL